MIFCNYSIPLVPLYAKEGFGEISLSKSPFSMGDVNNYGVVYVSVFC